MKGHSGAGEVVNPTVVVGYDHTPSSEVALIEAGREATWRGAMVKVVHAAHISAVLIPMTATPPGFKAIAEDTAAKIAALGAGALRERYPGLAVESVGDFGAPPEVLATVSSEAELLVLGSRGLGGFSGMLLGSVVLRTLARTRCPVMVVRGGEHEPRGAVLAAVDVEDPSQTVLDFAFTEAAAGSVPLHAVNVQDLTWARMYVGDTAESRILASEAMGAAEKAVKQLLASGRTRYPDVRVEAAVLDAVPSAALVQATKEVDVVVTGAHRHGGGRPGVRLGPVTHALVHHAHCPVVVVPR